MEYEGEDDEVPENRSELGHQLKHKNVAFHYNVAISSLKSTPTVYT